MASNSAELVLRLEVGRSEQRVVILEPGRAIAPFAVGSGSAWRVRADGVASAHVMLAFNGTVLFACTARGSEARLNGAPLEGRWTEVTVPSHLRFGGARIFIHARAARGGDIDVSDEAVTCIHDEARADAATVLGPTEAVTCFDNERLQAALRRSASDSTLTRMGDGSVPDAARATRVNRATVVPIPHQPAGQPPNRISPVPERHAPLPARKTEGALSLPATTTQLLDGYTPDPRRPAPLAVANAARVQPPPLPPPSKVFGGPAPPSMPPTMPSDGLMAGGFSPALSLPPSVTMAAPVASLPGSSASGASASTSERGTPLPHALDAAASASPSATSAQPGSWVEQKLERLRRDVRAASRPKKAVALLLVSALSGAICLKPPRSDGEIRAWTVATVAAPPAPAALTASPIPSAPLPAAAALPSTAASQAPRAGGLTPPTAGGSSIRDSRTAERRALDTAASGHDSAAAEQYEALASSHPESLAFREAARILRARATRGD